jgi:ribose 5-phosphate isomerase
VQEKIVAAAAAKFVLIADETKIASKLGCALKNLTSLSFS